MSTGNRIHHINLMVDDLDQYVDPAIFDEVLFEPEFLEAR